MKRLLAIFFFTSIACAGDIPPDAQIEVINDWGGGLNTQQQPHKLEKNMTPNSENVLIDEKPGSLVKRNGFVVAGSTTGLSKVNFLGEFLKSNGDKEMIVSDSSQVLTTKDFVNYIVIKSTLNTTAVIRMAQGRGKALLTNGSDPVFYYDGTNCTNLDGTSGFPNVPRGKFPVFYQDRFWIANTTANNSALHFSALSSTDGFAIDSLIDSRAWPPENQLNIGLGDGAAASALDVFKGQIQVHKDNRSIYTVFGTDEFTYFARKTNAHTGTVSHDSIAQSDNLEHYFSRNGVYLFDGGDSIRISDSIRDQLDLAVTNLTRVVDNTWNSNATFGRGLFQGTTMTASATFWGTNDVFPASLNGITVLPQVTINQYDSAVPASQFFSFSQGSDSSTPYMAITTQGVSNTFNGGVIFNATMTRVNFGITTLWFKNLRTGQEISQTRSSFGSLDIGILQFENFSANLDITSADVVSGNIQYKIAVETSSIPSGNTVQLSSIGVWGQGNIGVKCSTGGYVSDVATITTINFWDTFQSNRDTNGGTVNYYIKGATSVVNLATEPWTAIIPGAAINFATSKTRVQWAATVTANSNNFFSPVINNVVVNHNEGGASDTRPIGIEWKNRYWLAITTQATGTNTLIYVKSKITNSVPNAWVKFTGINIRSLAKFNDSLYAGSSSSGTIYRLDYGQNDNGAAINAFYETPDLLLGSNFLDKNLKEYMLDVEPSANATLSFKSSIDGAAYSNTPLSLNGSNRLLFSIKSAKDKAKYVRFRIENNELDKSLIFNTLGILYVPSSVRQ